MVKTIEGMFTHRTSEALPTPLASKGLNSLSSIPNALLTPFTLWQPQPHMTSLAIWMTLVHREPNIIIFKSTVSSDIQFSGSTRVRTIDARGKERVAAFGTEEVLFVIGPFAKSFIVESYEAFVDDGSFAMVATRSKVLYNTHYQSAILSQKKSWKLTS